MNDGRLRNGPSTGSKNVWTKLKCFYNQTQYKLFKNFERASESDRRIESNFGSRLIKYVHLGGVSDICLLMIPSSRSRLRSQAHRQVPAHFVRNH